MNNKSLEYLLQNSSLENNEQKWSIYNVHDPSIFKDKDTYYVFSTDAVNVNLGKMEINGNIQVRKSKDLIHWEWLGYAFEDVPKDAKEWTQAEGIWAPEAVKLGDTYYLYYSTSRFGKNQSFIGVATSSSIEGPWLDKGEVFKTKYGDGPNAIDPNIVFDKEGNPWLVYGSFFDGIFISSINPETGKLHFYDKGHLLACREHKNVSGSVEGPYLIYNKEFDMYYLFVSYDSLFKDYNIRVSRSKHIQGPYEDVNGMTLTEINYPPSEIGTKLMGGYRYSNSEGWLAPGHNSILHDDDNQYFIAHHVRHEKNPHSFCMHVRKVYWTQEGWPIISPERFAGEKDREIIEEEIPGDWEIIVFLREDNGVISSQKVTFLSEGKIKTEHNSDYWEFDKDNTLIIYYEVSNAHGEPSYNKYTARVLTAWEWENDKKTIVFTGMDKRGICIWGKKQS